MSDSFIFSTIQLTSAVVWTLFNYKYCHKHGFSKLKAFMMAGFNTVLTWSIIFLLSWMCNEFQGFGTQNAVRVFVTFPFIIWVQAKIFNVNFRELSDRYAVGPVLTYFVGHIACMFVGCCHGFEYEEGTKLYSIAHALTGKNMLPQQLFEVLGAFITSLVIYYFFIKTKQNAGGRLFWWMTIAYGTQRFFFEFFRDNKKLFLIKEMEGALHHDPDIHGAAYWGISELALWAIGMIIVGAIMLIGLHIVDNKKTKEPVCA